MTNFSELPLVFFTTFSQIAIGAYATLYLLGRNNHVGEKTIMLTAKLVVVLMALAMAGASTHLGDPMGGWRALLGLAHSWLSREILLMGAFLGLAFLYALPQLKGYRHCLGFCGSAAGVLGIVVTAMVYTLPARPAWDTVYPLLFFGMTALTAGPLLVSVVSAELEGKMCNVGLQLTRVMLLLGLLITVSYPLTQGNHLAMPSIWLAVRCLIGQVIPWFMLQRQLAGGQPVAKALLWTLLLVVLGELIGHQLFYESVVPYPLFPA
ncbi:MAG: dimethyl sulfoxide reductase anchor subunit [Selenomonas sp.]|uniref:dimethyl sulfoxide reductase anchor subunit family protein n=1 Tax=Selenomonas sp. TaxID=2053611 RepID=UPI0025DCD644|nr:DmsC/YnfH family molybdoenzyme membrane anchor subunit [Selenomonas sp.]MCR5756697.1 dimethyl sulfoxide reductase anchor subunit [Selenomonas sp.]